MLFTCGVGLSSPRAVTSRVRMNSPVSGRGSVTAVSGRSGRDTHRQAKEHDTTNLSHLFLLFAAFCRNGETTCVEPPVVATER